jgi:uncharacterized membrane protein
MAAFWRVIGHVAIFALVFVAGVFLVQAILVEAGKLTSLSWVSYPLFSVGDGNSLPLSTAAAVILSLLAATAAVLWRLRPATGRPHWIALGIVAAVLFVAAGAKLAFAPGNGSDASQQIAEIGSSNGDDLVATHISADGSTVVGVSQDSLHSHSRAFRWTRKTGLQFLAFPSLSKDRPVADATGVSANGDAIVGHYTDAHGSQHVYRWTAASGTADVGAPHGWQYMNDPAVSGDGTAVAGSYIADAAGKTHLYVWTKAHGFKDLGAGAQTIVPVAVTNDASVISGWFRNGDAFGIFQWTAANGFQNLGTIGKAGCKAIAASADGSAIVGYSWDRVNMIEGVPDFSSFIGGNVFLWTRATGIRNLGAMAKAKAMPQGISADGAVILGSRTDNKSGWQAFMWSEAQGVRDIGARNWHDSSATDISSDGSKILGHVYDVDLNSDNEINPADKREHFFVMPPAMVENDPSQQASGEDQSSGQPAQNEGNGKDLILVLVKDNPDVASNMSPVFDASGSGKTYIWMRDLTKTGEIESVTPETDAVGRKVLRVHLADAAGRRLAADNSIPGQEIALELEGGGVLAAATVQANIGSDFEISAPDSDIARILAAISSELVATGIPKVATAPKWIILDQAAKVLSKSVFVSAKTGLIHLTYCSMEPCEPPDDNVDVLPATVDCKQETFSWTNFMEVAVTDSLRGKHPVSASTEVLVQGLCSQKGSLPVRP